MGRILSLEMNLTNRMVNSSIEWTKPKPTTTNNNVALISQQIIDLNNSYNNAYKTNESSTTLVTGFQEFLPFNDDETDDYTDCRYHADDDGDDEEDESEEETAKKQTYQTFIEPSIIYPISSQSLFPQQRQYQDTTSLLPSPIYSFVNHQQQLLKDYQQQDQINLFSRLTTTDNMINSNVNTLFNTPTSPFPINNSSFFNWSELNMNMFNYDLAGNLIATLTASQSMAPMVNNSSNEVIYQMMPDESEDDYGCCGVDHIDKVMLKAYEDEENLVLEIEKVQNKELKSVLAQEAELTKQLSFQKQILSYSKYSGRQMHEEDEEDVDETETENEEVYKSRRSRTFYIEEESANESEVDAGKARKMHEKLFSINRNP